MWLTPKLSLRTSTSSNKPSILDMLVHEQIKIDMNIKTDIFMEVEFF